MRPMYLSIRQEATGKRIKELLRDNGYSVKDIQEVMLILSKLLHTSIEDILVVDGDIVIISGQYKQIA